MSKEIFKLIGSEVVVDNFLTIDPVNKQGQKGTVLTVDEKRDEITVKFDDGVIGIYCGIESFKDVIQCPIYNNGETWETYKQAAVFGTIKDEFNPNFLFSTDADKLLVMLINGEINPVELAKKELRNRGLDMAGNWIGFNKN